MSVRKNQNTRANDAFSGVLERCNKGADVKVMVFVLSHEQWDDGTGRRE